MRAIAAVLFLAVCAYCGAALGGMLSSKLRLTQACLVSVDGSLLIEGLAVREERLVGAGGAEISVEDGSRLKAGTVLAQNKGQAIMTECSAIYLQSLDGYEYLNPEMLRDLTVSAFSDILKCRPRSTKDAPGRLVLGHEWFFAALCPADNDLDLHGRCYLRFDGTDGIVSARVLSISSEENGQQAVLLRLSAANPELLGLRFCEAELFLPTQTGLKIPASALQKDDAGNSFVNILLDGAAQRRSVDIIYTDPAGQWSLSALSSDDGALQEGDTLICSADIFQRGFIT